MKQAGWILVAGSANVDYVTRVSHIPAPGETVLGPDYTLSAGGKGANQAVAAGRAGGQVRFLGALGRDQAADLLRRSLYQSGVQDASVTLDAPTGAAFISVSEAGENAITVASGANRLLSPEHLGSLDGVSLLLLVLEIPLGTVLACARRARAAGARVLLNASPARALPAELLACTDVLVVNEGELGALVGQAGDLEAKLSAAQRLGPQTVIVTLGGRGSLARWAAGLHAVPAHPVQVADTTGAGDTYLGVLAASLNAAMPLPAAMQRASVASALACTRAGAQPSMPWAAEIEAILASLDG
ncbi:ribokinase [Deinococcus sp.]|uniref:ribokinase n=1 Tax=Deinococcus sp. TaxID=47478 RepID=UPI003CC589D1